MYVLSACAAVSCHNTRNVGGAATNTRIGVPRTTISVVANGPLSSSLAGGAVVIDHADIMASFDAQTRTGRARWCRPGPR